MSNSKIFTALLLLAILAPTARAAENGELFGLLDHNQDGWLVENELEYQHRRLFQRLLRTADIDHDGRLTSDEFQAGLKPKLPAKPLVEKQGSELPGADALLLMLAKMDANSDGRIEEREVPEPLLDIFHRVEERLGGEPDGVLNRRELTQAGPRLSHIAGRIAERMNLDVEVELALLTEKQWQSVQTMVEPRPRGEVLADPQRAREFFQQFDTNGDGQITLAEVPDQFAQRFEQLLNRADRNHDDQVSEQELMAVSRQLQTMNANRPSPAELRAGVDRLLKQHDRNGDQQISRQEAPRRMAARFEQIDRDGNGSLNRAELSTVVEFLSRIRQPEARPQGKSRSRRIPEK